MKHFLIIATVVGLLLTGCATPQTAQPMVEPSAAATQAATLAPVSTATTAPTTADAPTQQATAPTVPGTGQSQRVFVILPEESSVSYQVGEVFINENNRYNLAVGVTQVVNGEITLDYTQPDQSAVGPITVDISAFKSDSNRRDNAIRDRWLESSRFPIATFTPTAVRGVPPTAKEGDAIDFEVEGDLTVRDTTKPVVFTVQATLAGDRLTGTATTAFKMTDFNFSPPDIGGMLKAEDDVKIEFKFVAVPKA